MASTLDKYLARHAAPEAALAEALPGGPWGATAVMPAYDEGDALAPALRSLTAASRPPHPTLLILVLNATEDAPPEALRRNDDTRGLLHAAAAPTLTLPSLTLHAWDDRLQVLLIDRSSPGAFLPPGGGVGHARRLGADLAAALHHAGRVQTPWIWSLDADATVPTDLLSLGDAALARSPRCAALVAPFAHVFADDPAQAEAGRLYDLSLRYYVLGLAWAGSPWAYWTLGSALASRASAYAAVRGFPRRTAGEDFYLLGKLAKQGPLYRGHGARIQIQARVSSRVPFGTGPAIQRWSEQDAARDRFPLYDPRCFIALRCWLEHLPLLAQGASGLPSHPTCPWLPDALERLGAPSRIERALAASPDPHVRLRHLHTWFDAFQTLKLIHACRDHHCPSPRWSEALRRAPFWPDATPHPDVANAQRRAVALEGQLGAALLGLGG